MEAELEAMQKAPCHQATRARLDKLISRRTLQVTLEQVHAAEAVLEAARKRAAEAAEKLDVAKFRLREEQADAKEAKVGEEGDEELPGMLMDIKVWWLSGVAP